MQHSNMAGQQAMQYTQPLLQAFDTYFVFGVNLLIYFPLVVHPQQSCLCIVGRFAVALPSQVIEGKFEFDWPPSLQLGICEPHTSSPEPAWPKPWGSALHHTVFHSAVDARQLSSCICGGHARGGVLWHKYHRPMCSAHSDCAGYCSSPEDRAAHAAKARWWCRRGFTLPGAQPQTVVPTGLWPGGLVVACNKRFSWEWVITYQLCLCNLGNLERSVLEQACVTYSTSSTDIQHSLFWLIAHTI